MRCFALVVALLCLSQALARDLLAAPAPAPASSNRTAAQQAAANRARQQRAQVLPTTYKVIIRAGDVVKNVTLGAVFTAGGRPLLGSDGVQLQANNPDFTSYITVGGELYSIVQFETFPGEMYVMKLDQNKNGRLTTQTVRRVDWSNWEGLYRPCAGVITPWNTHLGGEEAYPNVRTIEAALRNSSASIPGDVSTQLRYYGVYAEGVLPANVSGPYTVLSTTALRARALQLYRPFMTSHIFEARLNQQGNPSVVKHMALGRVAFEIGYVLPDRRTVYIGDDASVAGGLLKFVADRPADLSSGCLYAYRVKQVASTVNTAEGKFQLSQVKLGCSNQAFLLGYARRPIGEFNFSSIFNTAPTPSDPRAACPTGFRKVVWESNIECLQLNNATRFANTLAAFLETRRYLSYVGASSQFSKIEGITYNARQNKLYIALSTIQNAMLDNVIPADQASANEIRVLPNRCGCTYAIFLNNAYDAVFMEPQVCGIPVVENGVTTCDLDTPANPDNVSFMEGYDWLFITEDSGNRPAEQDFYFAHNVITKQNIRIAASERDAEVTAGYWHANLNSRNVKGFSYTTFNYQGPELPRRGTIGYAGPWTIRRNQAVTFEKHTPLGPEYFNPYSTQLPE